MSLMNIEWEIPRGEYINGRISDAISECKSTNGWKLQCVWSNKSTPKAIRIIRSSTAGDFKIDGTFKLMRNDTRVHKIKYSQIMASGSTSVEIELKGVTFPRKPEPRGGLFSLKGHARISRYIGKKDNVLSSLSELSKDLEQQLNPESRFATDVNLKCGSDSFPAHKFILSARSPVFAAMFANPMSESRENEVNIVDIDTTVLRVMVTYMYTGCIKTNPTFSLIRGLLVAADKYQVLSLKRICCDILKRNITLLTVLRCLDLGDSIAEDLKVSAMDYIRQCTDTEFSTMQNSKIWKYLETKKPGLAIEVLKTLMKSKVEKMKAAEESIRYVNNYLLADSIIEKIFSKF